MSPSLRLGTRIKAKPFAAVIGSLVFLLLIVAILASPTAKAGDGKVCSLGIDFGDGRIMWTDVPLSEGMNGFDVFQNGTKMLKVSESHSKTPPYGHTVIRIDNSSMEYDFTNPDASGRLWHLWYWDSAKEEWAISNTLVDGIDPTTTPAILFTYHQDPWGPPTIPLEHEVTTPPENSTSEPTPGPEPTPAPEPAPGTPSISGTNLSTIVSNFNYEVNDLNVTFEASSSNESVVSKYVWDFGDGSTGEGKSVEHNYTTEGNFTVTMTVANQTDGTKDVTQIVRLGTFDPAETPIVPVPTENEDFPIWGWGLIGLVLIGGGEAIYLQHRKLKRKR